MKPQFTTKVLEEKKDYGRFVVEPLEQGFGHTLGNALRRVLLTSLPGAALTTVKIDGIRHQFTTLAGLKEDMVEFILNLKQVRLRMTGRDKKATLFLTASGPGDIKARDIEAPAGVSITNPDLVLGHLADKKSKIKAEMTAAKGRGYLLAEEQVGEKAVGVIPIDASFSPVLRVNYRVEATRVGRMTDLDKLVFELWTDKTITPKEAFKEAAKILLAYFMQIIEPKLKPDEGEGGVKPAIAGDVLRMTIDELDLPTRVVNSLHRGAIDTVGQLLKTDAKKLLKLKNFGQKSLKLIGEKLQDKGVNKFKIKN